MLVTNKMNTTTPTNVRPWHVQILFANTCANHAAADHYLGNVSMKVPLDELSEGLRMLPFAEVTYEDWDPLFIAHLQTCNLAAYMPFGCMGCLSRFFFLASCCSHWMEPNTI